MDEPIYREGMEMKMKRMDLWTVGEGESETNGESSTNMYTLPGGRRAAGEKLLRSTGSQPGALS